MGKGVGLGMRSISALTEQLAEGEQKERGGWEHAENRFLGCWGSRWSHSRKAFRIHTGGNRDEVPKKVFNYLRTSPFFVLELPTFF
jgi:hypothetical protein